MEMLFKEFIEQKSKLTLFIDLDGTLVSTMPLKDFTDKSRGKVFDWDGRQYVTFARPNARKFLLECMKIGHTCIFTAGTHDFQETVIEALDFPIKEIYGQEDFHRVPQPEFAILVDNTPYIAFQKLAAIGMHSDSFLQIDTWQHTNLDDNKLIEFLPKIRNMAKQKYLTN